MLRAFERAERRGDDRVGVGAGRSDDVRRKAGVVAAAVLRVQHEREVENAGFQRGITVVDAEHVENVFGGGKLRPRRVDEKAVVGVFIVHVGLIAVNGKLREQRNHFDALAQHIFKRGVVRLFVIGVKRQHAARQGVHHVEARRLHDDVAHEIRRQGAVAEQQVFETPQAAAGWGDLRKAADRPFLQIRTGFPKQTHAQCL